MDIDLIAMTLFAAQPCGFSEFSDDAWWQWRETVRTFHEAMIRHGMDAAGFLKRLHDLNPEVKL